MNEKQPEEVPGRRSAPPRSAPRLRRLPKFGALTGGSFGDRIDLIVRVALMVVVATGCYLVLRPFLTAILLAAVIAVVTWPVFRWLLDHLRQSTTLAASAMVLLIIVTFLIPMSFLLFALAQQIPRWVTMAAAWLKDPAPVLAAVDGIPYVGAWLHEQLRLAIDPATFGHTVQRMLDPLSSGLVNAAVNVGNGVVQLIFVTFIVFFFYRDGAWFADRISALVERVSGGIAREITGILVNTTRSVVFGIVGTAIGQGLVAGVGFWIAGVPGVLVLSFAVFVLSVIPIGPPLIWGPAAVWLYTQGELGMALFLIAWGTLAVSSVDNFIKPILISRGTSMPIALIFLGVFGGVLAFGFLGLILGPLLLAVGVALFSAWLKRPVIELAHAAVEGEAPEASEAPIESKRPDAQVQPPAQPKD